MSALWLLRLGSFADAAVHIAHFAETPVPEYAVHVPLADIGAINPHARVRRFPEYLLPVAGTL